MLKYQWGGYIVSITRKNTGRTVWHLFLVTLLLLILVSGKLYAAMMTVDELLELNPDISDGEYFNLREPEAYQGMEFFVKSEDLPGAYQDTFALFIRPGPPGTKGLFKGMAFMVEVEREEIVMVQGNFPRDEWHPWFDQEEGRPAHIIVEGHMYSQQIYLKRPEVEFERRHLRQYSVDIELGEAVPLNFHELKEVNPGLAHYEELDPPVTEDGSFVFLAPRGPGIGLVAEANGDIYALIYMMPWEDGEGTLYHPQVGEVYIYPVFLRDPGGKFSLEKWLGEPSEDVVVKEDIEFHGFIEPGFVLQEINFSSRHGVVTVEGTMLNETGQNYMMAGFKIKFYGEDGVLLATKDFTVLNIADGQEGDIVGGFPLPPEIDLDNLIYEIEFVGGH